MENYKRGTAKLEIWNAPSTLSEHSPPQSPNRRFNFAKQYLKRYSAQPYFEMKRNKWRGDSVHVIDIWLRRLLLQGYRNFAAPLREHKAELKLGYVNKTFEQDILHRTCGSRLEELRLNQLTASGEVLWKTCCGFLRLTYRVVRIDEALRHFLRAYMKSSRFVRKVTGSSWSGLRRQREGKL